MARGRCRPTMAPDATGLRSGDAARTTGAWRRMGSRFAAAIVLLSMVDGRLLSFVPDQRLQSRGRRAGDGIHRPLGRDAVGRPSTARTGDAPRRRLPSRSILRATARGFPGRMRRLAPRAPSWRWRYALPRPRSNLSDVYGHRHRPRRRASAASRDRPVARATAPGRSET